MKIQGEEVKTIYLFSNGNTSVSDKNGKQIPEKQVSWLLAYLGYVGLLEDSPDIKIVLPDNRVAKVFKTDEGYNWEVCWK